MSSIPHRSLNCSTVLTCLLTPSCFRWAAYVAGTILVLMTELDVKFTDSMSILVSSDVPEGKGVSSSASVEVATMAAIAAAYGL
jgi:L-arabinokinase